ncbi:thiopeptide-type bacteriocin biosynthesis protein [Actinoplanes friuliensis]|uniref:Subtilin biosynthesis protein spaB n=1 Tax=Actinoplanes friuliensis DSM 7358 TaxID=1246995 RepID=U5VYU4_9ACTN|nr:thiopeptide-type bacteriocin biosynthesis protein [Actinoplanes friuliensis]AGZ41957.1 subtilin biosynthesis protein spaB [Actinoplanes friuliensis DSM 7358]
MPSPPLPPEPGAWRFLPLIMVRMPALSLAAFSRTTTVDESDPVGALWRCPELRDAVRLANPQLAAAADRSRTGTSDRRERLAAALTKYTIRMATRPTPFGLFAMTGFSTWGDGPLGPPATPPVRRRRIDSRRAAGLLREAARGRPVAANPTARVLADRITFQPPYATRRRTLRRSRRIDTLLAFTASPQPWAAVATLLGDETVASRLLDEGLLVSTLHPTAPEGFPPHWPADGRADLTMHPTGTVDRRLAEGLSAALAVLQRAGLATEADPGLRHYAAAFAERYGFEEVPLEDVADPASGLGPLPPLGASEDAPALDGLRRLLVRRGPVAVLSASDLADLPALHRGAAPSCDLFVQLLPDGRAAVTPRGAVVPGGRAFARFADADDRVPEHVRTAAHAPGEEDIDLVAMDYWHESTINLGEGGSAYDTVLLWSSVRPGRRALRVKDLLVGVQDGALYLRSRLDGRRVLVRTDHLVATETAPALLDLVHRISRAHVATPGWSWGRFADAHSALPRVETAGVVLSAARWRLPDDKITAWREDLQVPRFVYAGTGDTRLLLDLDHPRHRALLREQRRRGAEWAEECLFDPDGTGHVTEFVVTAVNDAYRPLPPLRTARPGDFTGTTPARLPGDGWWSTHVTCAPGSQDEVLGLLATYLAGQDARWFFTRYDNPAPHLRVRVHSEVLDVAQWCAALRLIARRGPVLRFTLEPYEPETRRYGGPAGLALCEQLFTVDTLVVLDAQHPADTDPSTLAAVLIDLFATMVGAAPATLERAVKRLAGPPPEGDRGARAEEHRQRRILVDLLTAGPGKELAGAYDSRPIDPALTDLINGEHGEAVLAGLLHMHLNRHGLPPTAEPAGARRRLAVQHSLNHRPRP